MSLTGKQRRFVDEYLIDLNATQAAIRAGYSEKTAYSIGQQNLKKLEVAAAIQQAMNKRSQRTEITADRVLQELALIGFADMGTYLNLDSGTATLDWSDLPEGATKVISEITQEVYLEGRGDDAENVKRTKFKLHDKRAALVDLGRHLKLFTDKTEVSADASLAALLGALDGQSRGLPKRS